jgi:hypothetical protein
MITHRKTGHAFAYFDHNARTFMAMKVRAL